MRLTLTTTTALVLSGLLTGSASAEKYQCNFPPATFMLAPQVNVALDEKSSGSAVVLDGVIQQTYGGPIQARVTNNTDRRLTVKWKVSLNSPLFYTVSILRPGLQADLQLNNPVTYEYWDVIVPYNEYGPTRQGVRGSCRQL